MRLSVAALDRLPPAVARPAYDIGAARIGVVHLGVGAFHRAHQAVYVDDRLSAGETGWAISAASLRSPETRDALEPQDGLYGLGVRDREGESWRVVGSIRRLRVGPEDPAALLADMCDPAVRIVSVTVTEKGYCHDPATGTLREDHPEVLRDLAAPSRPLTVAGLIVEALRLRRREGAAPFTVLCCDNLPANGETVRRVVSRFAALRDPDLGGWIEGEVAFPSTMVDRIVPATTDSDRAAATAALGAEDAWPVVTEPFLQWVIEDRFPGGRPRFEESGAELVADVAPFEEMKLRLLNGTHTAMALFGQLTGRETVSDAIADADLARLVHRIWAESGATLSLPAADVHAYTRALAARFANPALKHRTGQIVMDCSQKLPQRLLAPIRQRLAKGEPIDGLALAVAAFLRFSTGEGERGEALPVNDPLGERLKAIARKAGPSAERLAPAILGVTEIFGADLPRDPRFTGPVTAALARLLQDGARRTLALAP